MKPIIFINSHPIQYFAPLYKAITQQNNIDLSVWYCSDETVKGAIDKEFGVNVQWDTPILNGYAYKFFKNNSLKPSLFNGFWGLFNLDLLVALKKQIPSVIIIHGWGYATHFLVILFAKFFGHTVCLRAETPLNQELVNNKVKLYLKHSLLKLLFKRIDYFLFIGTENKRFYEYLNINKNKLLSTPYCVDNKYFNTAASTLNKDKIKIALNIPLNYRVILFSGKYIDKKRPLDLITAFANLPIKNTILIMVGEGHLRKNMEASIEQNNINDRVRLTGFINQTKIPAYYAVADVFVMCSGVGETWGLSVNEAMNFGLPIIISDICGCSSDLVEEDVNGYTFEVGDIKMLTTNLNKILSQDPIQYSRMCKNSIKIINEFSFDKIIETIHQLQHT